MHFAHCWNTKYLKIIPFIHPSTKSCCWFSQTMVFPGHLWHVICPVCLGFRVSYSCTCLKYLAHSRACYFLWKWGKNDKSLLPLQQMEDVAFLATCFPLNIFPTGGKNVGYYSRPSETKNSCVNSRFSQTRIIVIDMRSFCMFSCGKCPHIDGVKHKYCSNNSAVKHICNQWFFFVEHVALFPPDLTFLRHPLFLPFKFFPKSTCITDTETNSWYKDKLPLKPPRWSPLLIWQTNKKLLKSRWLPIVTYKNIIISINNFVDVDAWVNQDSSLGESLKCSDRSLCWTRSHLSFLKVNTGYFWSLCFQSLLSLWAQGPRFSISTPAQKQSHFVCVCECAVYLNAAKIDC